jgi:hypothetical protein
MSIIPDSELKPIQEALAGYGLDLSNSEIEELSKTGHCSLGNLELTKYLSTLGKAATDLDASDPLHNIKASEITQLNAVGVPVYCYKKGEPNKPNYLKCCVSIDIFPPGISVHCDNA